MDGFRVGAVKRILEATHLRDEPQVDPKKPPVSCLSVVFSPQLVALFFLRAQKIKVQSGFCCKHCYMIKLYGFIL